jgi:hypothetical protein
LHVQLHPLPPAQAVLGLAGPRPERAVLAGPRHVTDRNGRGVLQRDSRQRLKSMDPRG